MNCQNQRQIKNRLSEAVAASGPGRWSSSNAQRRKRGEERPVDGGHCRIWVNLVVLSVRRSFPVYPKKKQTFSVSVGMSQRCHKRTQALQHDRHKTKDRFAAAFPKLNLVCAGATDELSRSLKLDHIDAGQRDLVNDRIRQSVSRNLILIGVVNRHSIYRHDYVKATQCGQD